MVVWGLGLDQDLKTMLPTIKTKHTIGNLSVSSETKIVTQTSTFSKKFFQT